jgi:hypothetical protein
MKSSSTAIGQQEQGPQRAFCLSAKIMIVRFTRVLVQRIEHLETGSRAGAIESPSGVSKPAFQELHRNSGSPVVKSQFAIWTGRQISKSDWLSQPSRWHDKPSKKHRCFFETSVNNSPGSFFFFNIVCELPFPPIRSTVLQPPLPADQITANSSNSLIELPDQR